MKDHGRVATSHGLSPVGTSVRTQIVSQKTAGGEPRSRARGAGATSWVLLGAFGLLALAGCASTSALAQGAPHGQASTTLERPMGPEPHKVGPVNVWLRPQPEVEFLCRLRLPAMRRDQRVMGCYLADSRTIISVADPYVIMHEFRHHFEGRFHD